MKHSSVTRKEFVLKFMHDAGLSYAKAIEVYDVMVEVFMDGIVSGSRVRVGRLGVLQPAWRNPKTIHLGCRRIKGGGYQKTRRVYHMDGRYSFKLRLYKKFVATHALKWFAAVNTDE